MAVRVDPNPEVARSPPAGCNTGRVTYSRVQVLDLLRSGEVRPSRALGQNFVADANTVRRIARLAGVGPGDRVVEIGAGLGSLTLALDETGAEVTAVEVDRHLVPILGAVCEPAGVRVVPADATTLDWTDLLGDGQQDRPWTLVANLPYNVAVPIVVRVLEEAPSVTSLLVMVQREVGERLVASAGDPGYGAVSVKVRYWGRATLAGRVPASVFVPRPNVESVLVRIERRAQGDVGGKSAGVPGWPLDAEQYRRVFTVVRAGFAQRRKMLRRSLAGVVDPAAFEAAGVAPTDRAEQLDLDRWLAIALWEPTGATRGRPG